MRTSDDPEKTGEVKKEEKKNGRDLCHKGKKKMLQARERFPAVVTDGLTS